MLEHPTTKEKHWSPEPSESSHFMHDEYGSWAATIDSGHNTLPLPDRLGNNLAAIFAAQEGKRGPLADLSGKWQLLNCRKTVALGKGAITPDDLGSMEGPTVQQILQASGFNSIETLLDDEGLETLGIEVSREQMHDTDGVLDLLRAIKALQADPDGEVTLETDGGEHLIQHIEELEEEAPGLFPLEVHVFHPLPSHLEAIRERVAAGHALPIDDFYSRMHRNHSFIVLGRDSAGHMLCVHKGSAKEYDAVSVAELSEVVRWGYSIDRDGDHLIALGPIQMPARAA